MFLIKWRMTACPSFKHFSRWRYGWKWYVRTGLSRYPTREAAEQRVVVWQRMFPFNTYYVEAV